jgi:hypothetical protein
MLGYVDNDEDGIAMGIIIRPLAKRVKKRGGESDCLLTPRIFPHNDGYLLTEIPC